MTMVWGLDLHWWHDATCATVVRCLKRGAPRAVADAVIPERQLPANPESPRSDAGQQRPRRPI